MSKQCSGVQHKVLMPPLHIKLDLVNNFVKAMVKYTYSGSNYLCDKFANLNKTKLKEGNM